MTADDIDFAELRTLHTAKFYDCVAESPDSSRSVSSIEELTRTGLVDRARHILKARKPDLIFGWYLTSYGVAAAELSRELKVPCVLMHAGSDVVSLARSQQQNRVPDILDVNAIITVPDKKVGTILGAVFPPKVAQLIPRTNLRLPSAFRGGWPADWVAPYRRALLSWLLRAGIPESFAADLNDLTCHGKRKDVPVITVYGKAGIEKGSYELIAALDCLAAQDISFQFLVCASGHQSELIRFYTDLHARPLLLKRTLILPPIPYWRIPALLGSSDIVCCLENGFEPTFHTPNLPREVLASARCLISSQELAQKAAYRSFLIDGENAVIIESVTVASLVSVLTALLRDPERRNQISINARFTSDLWEQTLASDAGNPIMDLLGEFLGITEKGGHSESAHKRASQSTRKEQ